MKYEGNIASSCTLVILLQHQEDVKTLYSMNFFLNLEIQVIHVLFREKAVICKCLQL